MRKSWGGLPAFVVAVLCLSGCSPVTDDMRQSCFESLSLGATLEAEDLGVEEYARQLVEVREFCDESADSDPERFAQRWG